MSIVSSIIVLVAALGVVPAPKEAKMSGREFNKANISNVRYKNSVRLAGEAYVLKIGAKGITVRYSSEAGRFYAEKTLGQLARQERIFCGTIKDEPRFGWRGFMLDEARHFFGMEKVKEVLDVMAEFKLNRFHWHLTDNQGWRIEIKALPELTTVGAIGCETDKQAPARFYTQDEIREIVRYAAERHIEIIPEIDMPGHARAAVRSLPEIDGQNGTMNPGSERTYELVETILREVASLFPGRYIHIGGDEVLNKKWPDLPEVKDLMEREGFRSVQEVQDYFCRRVAAIVKSLGKEVLAWDDLAVSDVPAEGTVLQWWRANHPEFYHKAIDGGFRVVVCPHLPMYLDYCQEEWHQVGHIGRNRKTNTLKQIYCFPVEDNPLVLGVQANLWTEHVHNYERLDFMAYPRLIALAELAWSSKLDYDSFLARLESVYDWMDGKNLYYYDSRNPSRHPEPACPNIRTNNK